MRGDTMQCVCLPTPLLATITGVLYLGGSCWSSSFRTGTTMTHVPRGHPRPMAAPPPRLSPHHPLRGPPLMAAVPTHRPGRGWMPQRPPPPRGPWPMQHWPAPPAHLLMRPPPLPRFGPRVPRAPAPPTSKNEHDAAWLQSFLQQHLPERDADMTDAREKSRLRPIKKRLREIEALVDELEAAASELADVEERLQSSNDCDETERSRMRVQAERKRSICEELRSRLEQLQVPRPLGLGEAKYRDVLAYKTKIEKKKRYRERRADRIKAEAAVRRGLERDQSLEQEGLNMEQTVVQSQLSESVRSPGHHEIRGMSAAQMPRGGAEQPTFEASLRRSKRRRRRRRRCPHASNTSAESTKPRLLPLREPYPADMETLVFIRRQWDAYLAPRGVQGASMIPPHFVSPPIDPGPQWALFLTAGRYQGDEDSSSI